MLLRLAQILLQIFEIIRLHSANWRGKVIDRFFQWCFGFSQVEQSFMKSLASLVAEN